jgi:hypothetical protein
MSKVLKVNSVQLRNDKTGEIEIYLSGHEFADDDPALEKLGDHCFAEPDFEEVVLPALDELNVRELRKVLDDLGVKPTSNQKAALIKQIREHSEEVEA